MELAAEIENVWLVEKWQNILVLIINLGSLSQVKILGLQSLFWEGNQQYCWDYDDQEQQTEDYSNEASIADAPMSSDVL